MPDFAKNRTKLYTKYFSWSLQMFTTNILSYGKDDPLPQTCQLRAGPVTAVYDNGDLRYIRVGGVEVVRRLYSAVRDHNWGTVSPTLHNVQIEQGDDSFRVTYTAHHTDASLDIDFEWDALITGDSDGTVRFEMNGRANSTFRRNRVGFCVLHPMDLAGQTVTVEHDDGNVDAGKFPSLIAPHQPFFDIRAIRHAAGDSAVEIRFEGELFEMEDQRNWTDASYKTYCTPLGLPFPVTVEARQTITQAVTISVNGGDASDADTDSSLTFNLAGANAVPLPGLGLGVATHGAPLTEREVERLKTLKLDHLRVNLHLGEDYGDTLNMATDQARALDTALLIAAHVTDDADSQLATLATTLVDMTAPLTAFIIYHEGEVATSSHWIALAKQHLGSFDVPIGAGTDAFFTELNRNRPDNDHRDFVTFSTNPQVHAFENVDLVETLACHAPVIETTQSFAHDKPITVGPVTLKMRFNPNATVPEPEIPAGQLPPQVDTRQMSLFGAGWTLGSLKYLSSPAVERITYYETTGWRGLMETDHAMREDPMLFPVEAGHAFPMYAVFADIADFVGGDVLPGVSSDSLTVDGLVLEQAGWQRLLLTNFTADEQTVTVNGLSGEVRIKTLDATNAEAFMRDPEGYLNAEGEIMTTDGTLTLVLPPFAYVRVDLS
jgi:hypothetical protein